MRRRITFQEVSRGQKFAWDATAPMADRKVDGKPCDVSLLNLHKSYHLSCQADAQTFFNTVAIDDEFRGTPAHVCQDTIVYVDGGVAYIVVDTDV